MVMNTKIVDFLEEFTTEKGEKMVRVVVEMPKGKEEYDYMPTPERVSIAHDYVSFHGAIHIQQQSLPDGTYPIKDTLGARNYHNIEGSITIGIRDMFQVVLPLLNSHPYLTDEHICIREKGTPKAYPAYAFDSCIMHYIDNATNTQMVAFRRRGSGVFERVSLELFNTIKGTLKLALSIDELNK